MSAFSLNEFYQRNRRVVIWVILFLLLWLLRDFFAVVFLSFVLAIVAAPLAEIGMRRLRLPHWAAVTVVYVSFLVVLGSFVAFVVPSVISQLDRMIQNLPSTEATLIETKNRLVRSYPALREPINGYLRSALADDRLELVELEPSAPASVSASRRRTSRPLPKAPPCRPACSPSTSTGRISCCWTR